MPPGYEWWMWVPMRDELHLCMRSYRAFTGFHEGIIAFPPSYRWFRVRAPDGVGDLAADYLDAQRLLDSVYTTWVKRKGSVAERAVNRVRRSLSLSRSSPAGPPTAAAAAAAAADISRAPVAPTRSAQGSAKDGAPGQALGEEGKEEGKGQRPHPETPSEEPPLDPTQPLLGKLWSRRTPSYTDRIVFFSLPGAGGHLASAAYEMADFIGACMHTDDAIPRAWMMHASE